MRDGGCVCQVGFLCLQFDLFLWLTLEAAEIRPSVDVFIWCYVSLEPKWIPGHGKRRFVVVFNSIGGYPVNSNNKDFTKIRTDAGM